MAKAVFIQNPDSIYDDRPGQAYHFPRQYLGNVRQTVGDWVIFYEGRRGAFGYVSVQKVLDVTPDTGRADHFYALLDPSSEWSFEAVVPRSRPDGMAALRGQDGRPASGGANVSAVRRLSEAEFAAIVHAGLRSLDDETELWSERAGQAMHEPQSPFDHAPLAGIRPEMLVSRKYRDRSFQRQVLDAYGYTCAISGLSLRNGGGRPEVQAAHIRPVRREGPDTVRNGLALSGTLHWMFDRGLVSVAEDHRILISHNKVPDDVVRRLVVPGQRLHLPRDPRAHPHPDYLRFHREEVFGQYD